jgi:preprotein translocase subunit YajC
MILREGDKVRKTGSGIIYEVKKIHDKGFVILSSEDGSRTALMNAKAMGLYFTLVGASLAEGRNSSFDH